jgi:hypothetical protein
VSELLGVGMAITDATLDRVKMDEREATSMRKELEHLRHQVEYYQDTTQEIILLKGDFMEVYSRFKSERDIFMDSDNRLPGRHSYGTGDLQRYVTMV